MGSSNQSEGYLAIIKWATENWNERYREVYEFKLFQVSGGFVAIALNYFIVILYRDTFW